MWNKQYLLQKAREQVSEKRFIHIEGVIATAIQLAKQESVNVGQAEVAAILHDYCKAWEVNRMKEVLLAHNDTTWLEYPPPVWHAPAAVYIVKSELGIDDDEVLQAIYYHTTGRPNMTPLEKVLWVADYIEPNRNFPGVEIARELAKGNIDHCLRYGLANTIHHLVAQEQPIYPLTFEAYNYYFLNRRS